MQQAQSLSRHFAFYALPTKQSINKTIYQQGRFQINLEPIDTDTISMVFLKGTSAFDWLLCFQINLEAIDTDATSTESK
jgi:hypothetical protein